MQTDARELALFQQETGSHHLFLDIPTPITVHRSPCFLVTEANLVVTY